MQSSFGSSQSYAGLPAGKPKKTLEIRDSFGTETALQQFLTET